jgi:hypothetical protein
MPTGPDPVEQYDYARYPLHQILCPIHGLQKVFSSFHPQQGTFYKDGSFDIRWHEQTACRCRFDVYYSYVRDLTTDTVTIYQADAA